MRWFWQKKDNKVNEGAGTERVRVFDFDTQQITTIPAAELAPGMVSVRMKGIEGTVWVDATRLEQNVFQHPPFSEEAREYLRQIKAALDEVYSMSLEQWEDGFRRDRTPEREIAHWLHLSQVYSRLTAPDDELGSTLVQRKAVFKLLIGCGVAPKEQVLTVTEYAPLTKEEAERVVTTFFGEEVGTPAS